MKRRLVVPFLTILVAAWAVSSCRAQVDPFADEFKAPARKKADAKDPPKKQQPVVEFQLPDELPNFKGGLPNTTDEMLKYVTIKASVVPDKVRRGQVVEIVLDVETKSYAYTYSAVRRSARQAGNSTTFGYDVKWLRPLYPIVESEPELYKTKDDTAFILHDRFQWKQQVYVEPNAPVGPQQFAVKVRLQVCTKENKEAGTANSCLQSADYVPLAVKIDVSNEPPLPPPADLEARSKPTNVVEERPFADLTALLASAFVGAMLMLLTPCVFPMIPITVNFFIKQSEKEHHRPFLMASVYAGTIVLLLTCVIVAAGKSIIDLANEPWFNLGLGLVLILFALGLFGLIEVDLTKFFGAVLLIALGYGIAYLAKTRIPFFAGGNQEFLLAVVSIGLAVPVALILGKALQAAESALGMEQSFLLNYFARQESKGGLLGAAFMAMTFTVTSFSCTGPFLGIMLAPLAGSTFTLSHLLMAALVYSVTFAAPFFLLALFPTYLKKLPKSGGWMTTIKVTMGFLEIGAALKFFANVDLFWFPGNARLFGYDTVLCSWIALSVACSLYLFNVFHLDHDAPENHIKTPRMIFATIFLGMALYLLPLLFGMTPTGLVMESAISFLPPSSKGHGEIAWIEDDYEAAWKEAARDNKFIFIDFTGQNCANCRANERNAFTKRSVIRELKNYVCLQLYTDSVPNPTLTSGQARQQAQKQQTWQIGLVNDVTNPLYVVFEPDPEKPFTKDGKLNGRVVAQFRGYISDVGEFAKLLEKAQKQ